MSAGTLGQAAGLFAVTNIDDILVLALFFAQGAGRRGTTREIALGQYLGFIGGQSAVVVPMAEYLRLRAR